MTGELRTSSKVPHLFILGAAVSGIIALAAGFSYFGSGASASGKRLNVPIQQQHFCERVIAADREYDRLEGAKSNESNPFRQAAIQTQIDQINGKAWNDLYALIGPSGEFKGWRGKLRFYPTSIFSGPHMPGDSTRETTSYLEVVLVVCDAPDYGLQNVTYVTSLWTVDRGANSNTHVPANSPLIKSLASLDLSRPVIASGNFLFFENGKYSMHGSEMSDYGRLHFVAGGPGVVVQHREANLAVSFKSIAQAP